jgi:formylglycine-generating enzyme required for sulfatase activity
LKQHRTDRLKHGHVGRADLAQALATHRRDGTGGKDSLETEDQIAGLLGFFRTEPRARPPKPAADVLEQAEVAPASLEVEARPMLPTPFWRPESFVPRQTAKIERVPSVVPIWSNRPKQPPQFHVLSQWRDLEGTLRALIGTKLLGTEIDTEAVVEALSRGRQLDRLPLEKRRRWGGVHVQVVVDRSDRLVPFWQDQDLVTAALRSMIADHRFELAVIHETLDEPRLLDSKASPSPYRPPPPGGVVLVLGDLGSLDDDAECRRRWRAFGHRLASGGCRAVALAPCPSTRCAGDLRGFWRILPWERRSPPTTQDEASLRQRARRLLRLVSPAVRIEPGFLRAVRRMLGPDAADAGTEADVWQHPALSSRSCVAASLLPDVAKELRAEFAEEPPEMRGAVLELLRRWRHGTADEIWFEEILNLAPESRSLLPHQADVEDAQRFFSFLNSHPGAMAAKDHAVKAWLGRVELRTTKSGWRVRELARAIYTARKDDPSFVLPAEVDPNDIPVVGSERSVDLWQRSSRLHRGIPSGTPSVGSMLGIVRASNDQIQIEELTGREAFWASGRAPTWAHDWGQDECGPWASFSVSGRDSAPVIQRLRWAPPGRFAMGSPPDESGGSRDEGPLHAVTISAGFWIFETACSQGMWDALMGDGYAVSGNVRGSDEPRLPITNISWDEAQTFVAKINAKIPGLDLALPSEAQWEYACRAGTKTPYYSGNRISRELANFASVRPVRVGSLPPNPWGLREVHGNIYEWCADHWHGSYDGAPSDGSTWIGSGGSATHRVVRGGAWLNDASNVRAASRFHYNPVTHLDLLGFRCARLHATKDEAAPANGWQAKRRPSQGPANVVGQLDEAGWPLPRARRFMVRTNRDELYFDRITKPLWASAIGRDRFGLYADLSLLSKSGGDVIQRLRWIPPGRFLMGSPGGEEGRDDNEGPQHEVIIGHGYWLFDTPCTQALWEAMMGSNPSRFKSPTRPVETVSFKGAQEFLQRFEAFMRERDPDLGANARWDLPSESLWEYACRAGTGTATHAGEMRILGERNAPVLDAIAWYSGNSGVVFELANGEDSSGWPEKQYAHERAGTHPVGMKTPNPWGLYDMLGNVWEWCADHWHENYFGAPSDGSAWIGSRKGYSLRAVRGGSWDNVARDVRAPCRAHFPQANRLGYLGFRCARVQVVSTAGSNAERAGRGKPARRAPQRSGSSSALPIDQRKPR